MLEKFKKFALNQPLSLAGDRILLAVSGGIDSMVMASLFQQSGLVFGIAHCHFGLRGEEANLDQHCVRELAEQYGVAFHTIQWDTKAIAAQRKQSIQLCARELRYEWLEEIRKEKGYSLIATAHHLNDSLETVLYNFTKGCGIRGLLGVPIRNGHIIRPISFATKEEIQVFCQEQNLAFREDASNAEDKYIRNQIRQQVVPVLKGINPSLEATVADNLQRLRETNQLYLYAVEQLTAGLIRKEGMQTIIDYKKLLQQPAFSSLCYEILAPFGFNNQQVNQLLQISAEKTGRQFYSSSHQLLVERGSLIVRPLSDQNTALSFTIHQNTYQLKLPRGEQLSFDYHSSPPLSFPDTPSEVFLDASQLQYPLLLRRWQKGDRFQPLGMKGKSQSLQDFFTNHKFSLPQKEACWILLSGDQICWIVGHRIDERFKVKGNSKNCLQISYLKRREA